MSVYRIQFRCGHTRAVDLPPSHEPELVEPLIQNLRGSLCPACAASKERNDERRFVSCPE